MTWVRLHTEVRYDRKLRRLPAEQRWLWITLITLAKDSPKEGWLFVAEGLPLTIEDLADEAAISVEHAIAGMKAFMDMEMIEDVDGAFKLVNWEKRQFRSDSSAERTRHWRARKQETARKDNPHDDNVTSPESHCDSRETPCATTAERLGDALRVQNTECRDNAYKSSCSPLVNESAFPADASSDSASSLAPECPSNKGDASCTGTADSDFDTFWNHYPPRGDPRRKQGKARAHSVWKRLRKKRELPELDLLLQLLETEKKSRQWKDPQFIPMASSWLNSKPWQDGAQPDADRSGTSVLLDRYYKGELEDEE